MRIFCIFLALIFIMACYKDEDISKNDVLLLAKSLDEIKHDLRGVWELHYTWGGYTGSIIHYNDFFVNFHDGNSISIIVTANIWVDNGPLFWIKDFNNIKDRFGGNDSIFYMTYSSADQITYNWLPIRIKDDTLEIWDIKMADGLAYFLTHTK